MVQPVPEGFRSVTPFIMVNDAAAFLDFMKKGLNAQEVSSLYHDEGVLMHAQMKIGDSMIMVGDPGDMPEKTAALYLYVPDPDAAYGNAIKAGAKSEMKPKDEFYGDRMGGVTDEWGNAWFFAKHIEDVAEDELKKRACESMKEHRQRAAE